MKTETALALILAELSRAEQLHPVWPNNHIHAGMVVTEECGELVQAILNHHEKKGSRQAIITEAVQTAAMALRFLKNMEEDNNHDL